MNINYLFILQSTGEVDRREALYWLSAVHKCHSDSFSRSCSKLWFSWIPGWS